MLAGATDANAGAAPNAGAGANGDSTTTTSCVVASRAQANSHFLLRQLSTKDLSKDFANAFMGDVTAAASYKALLSEGKQIKESDRKVRFSQNIDVIDLSIKKLF